MSTPETRPQQECERCPTCALRGTGCVCSQLTTVNNPVHVTIVRHSKERGRASNSVRILAASLQNVTVLEHGARYSKPTEIPSNRLDDAVLLFPILYNPDPKYPPTEWTGTSMPKNLIVLDGSWNQTSRILKKVPHLLSLPRIVVEPLTPSLPRIRTPYFPGGMCTMEATISALTFFLTTQDINTLKNNYLCWIDQVRKNSGLREPLKPGQSIKEARIEQDKKQLSSNSPVHRNT